MLLVFKALCCRESLNRSTSIRLSWGSLFQKTTLHSKFVTMQSLSLSLSLSNVSEWRHWMCALFFSSFYGRIENSIGCLPRFYYHNKPHIEFTESGQRSTHHGAPAYSYNWITGNDRSVEEIESKTGKLKSHNGISRLSKRSLFHKFLNIKPKLPDIDRTRGFDKLLYAHEKSMAEDYQVCIFNGRFINGWCYKVEPLFFISFFIHRMQRKRVFRLSIVWNWATGNLYKNHLKSIDSMTRSNTIFNGFHNEYCVSLFTNC